MWGRSKAGERKRISLTEYTELIEFFAQSIRIVFSAVSVVSSDSEERARGKEYLSQSSRRKLKF